MFLSSTLTFPELCSALRKVYIAAWSLEDFDEHNRNLWLWSLVEKVVTLPFPPSLSTGEQLMHANAGMPVIPVPVKIMMMLVLLASAYLGRHAC